MMQMIICDYRSVSLVQSRRVGRANRRLANANAAGAKIRYFIASDSDVLTTASQFDGVPTQVAQCAILDRTINSRFGKQIASNANCGLRIRVSRSSERPIGVTEHEPAKDDIVNGFLCGQI